MLLWLLEQGWGPILSSKQCCVLVLAWTELRQAVPSGHSDHAGAEQPWRDSALPDTEEAHLLQPANPGSEVSVG